MVEVAIDAPLVARLLKGLLNRPVSVSETGSFESHPATRCGLVTNDDRLVGLIAADLAFAHRAGASLAMIPAGAVEDQGNSVEEIWIEFYREVANVLSRTVNEASPQRVRIDPGISHAPDDLAGVEAAGGLTALAVSIDGYGDGNLLVGVNGLG